MNKPTLTGCLIGSCLLLLSAELSGQGTQADFDRANGLAAQTRNQVFRNKVPWNVIPGSESFWYDVATGPRTHEFVLVDPLAAERKAAFDHEQLAASLSEQSGEQVRPVSLPFRSIEMGHPDGLVGFEAFGKRWWFDPADGAVRTQEEAARVKLESLDRVRSSGRRGVDSEIRLINRLDEPVRTFWVDERGDWKEYDRILPGGQRAQHSFANHVWVITDLARQPIAVFVVPQQPVEVEIDRKHSIRSARNRRRSATRSWQGSTSPDGKWKVAIVDSNVVLREVATGEGDFLTDSGSEEDRFTSRFYWSPDSTRLVVIQEKPAQRHEVQMVDSSPKDQVQPKLVGMNYLKPGDQIAQARPRLFDIVAKREIPVDAALFSNPWSLRDIRWHPDSNEFFFLYNQRGHQVLRVLGVDGETGEVRSVIDETSPTFIDYSRKYFSSDSPALDEMVWMSERDGWNHLYLINVSDGKIKRPLTQGAWVVRGVERIDWSERKIWIRLSGYFPDQDPYYIHHARVDIDSGELVMLTAGDGDHQIEYLPGGRWLIDRYSRVDMPPVHELRDAETGHFVCALERADWKPLLATGWQVPERFRAKGRDGETDIYGVIYRPSNFDPDRRYPVIEDIYAGPHSSFVPKKFGLVRRGQVLAELGFIVVQIDGMGTSNRSKAFHDVCHKNLGDSGFPDRIAWIRAAAEKYPAMDLSRVGIFGGSAGGQSALRALLAFGDFYHVAVSDCGCHDNRMDKIWWNELWMGWPIGPHYAEQSNVTQAHRLEGKLLLTVGELDRNVDPASTMQVVDALIKANKDFDFIIVPGAGHGIGESPYLKRRRRDFFIRHLWGVEPRRPSTEEDQSDVTSQPEEAKPGQE